MNETKFIWQDGKLIPWAEATTHLLTHTLHYGGGAFEGIRAYMTQKGPAIFRLEEHVTRLFYSAGTLEMVIPYTPREISSAIVETVRENEVESCYIRPLVYFGYGKMGLNPIGAPVNVAIACWPWAAFLGGENPVKVKTSKFIRIHPESCVSDAKICGHYANSIMASLEMKRLGVDEALFLDFEGKVAEGPGENIFMVKGNSIYTPKLGKILAGITRDSIMTIAGDFGYQVEEADLSPSDLMSADELFFTGTAVEIQPIGELDGQSIGGGEVGPVTAKLRKAYLDAVQGKNEKYKHWLTYVNDKI